MVIVISQSVLEFMIISHLVSRGNIIIDSVDLITAATNS